jgi:transcriptional regulator with XRE-family HTH domain
MHNCPNLRGVTGPAHPKYGHTKVPLSTTVVGSIIGTHRYDQNLTLRELSKLSGIGKSQLSAIENDAQNDLKVSQIIALARAFNLRPEELFQEYLNVLSQELDKTSQPNG